MNSDRKALAELTVEDFGRCRIWRVELPKQEMAAPVDPSEDLSSDGQYIALTDYVLGGGASTSGYCTIPDCSVHVLFDGAGKVIPITLHAKCPQDEASSLARALGGTVERLFPISYQVTVTIGGKYLEGEIAVLE